MTKIFRKQKELANNQRIWWYVETHWQNCKKREINSEGYILLGFQIESLEHYTLLIESVNIIDFRRKITVDLKTLGKIKLVREIFEIL